MDDNTIYQITLTKDELDVIKRALFVYKLDTTRENKYNTDLETTNSLLYRLNTFTPTF